MCAQVLFMDDHVWKYNSNLAEVERDSMCVCVCECMCVWVSVYQCMSASLCLPVCVSICKCMSASLCLLVCVCRSWSRLRWCGWCPASGTTTGTRGRAVVSSTLRPETWRTFRRRSSRNFRKCRENSKSVATELCWNYTMGRNNCILPTQQYLYSVETIRWTRITAFFQHCSICTLLKLYDGPQ